jgi:hypothetical protein
MPRRTWVMAKKDKEPGKRRQKVTGGGDTTSTDNYEGVYAYCTYIASKALESLKYIGFDISSMVGG